MMIKQCNRHLKYFNISKAKHWGVYVVKSTTLGERLEEQEETNPHY